MHAMFVEFFGGGGRWDVEKVEFSWEEDKLIVKLLLIAVCNLKEYCNFSP